MKHLVLSTLLSLTGLTAQAKDIEFQVDQYVLKGREMARSRVTVPVDISSKNVKFSKADYMVPVVKILIPELAEVTFMDHRNTGEGAPCLAAYEAKSPAEVIQNNPAKELAELDIITIKTVEPQAGGICSVTIHEAIEGEIRGQRFVHLRSLQSQPRVLEDCK